MSLVQSHLAKYKHNKEFIAFGINHHNDEYFYDWYITVDFYAVIHLVESVIYFLDPTSQISSHDDRMNYINMNPKTFNYHRFTVKYNALKGLCRDARYKTDITGLDQCKEADKLLEEIEYELRNYI